MRVYIAGPLFNEMERSRNEEIAFLLEGLGHTTYLPQRDGGVFSEMVKRGVEVKEARSHILREDITALESADCIVCLLDGRVPDEGMCVELGIAHTLKKKCIGYRTDSRIAESGGMNIIVEGCLETIVDSREELVEFFSKK